ncbi:helix-turn-helix domain-containing protein [Paenibacillus nuruki]|uniref:helix-turn-helix domain-containing protein n=1 Tax=Paenibacillus nuruki TaxID=1886670 RepID=UPI0028063B52|nr:helix-turn-helix transcriptional regulator [Paenibacillus nuruki]CAJ1314689.1 HTH cro/C1-type domain-containing protein [Paenibacillus nuruki]
MLNGERLREERIAQNLTQEDMAKKLGITRQAYGNYETGKRDVDSQTLVKLAITLDVSVDYLLGLSKNKNNNTDKNSVLNNLNDLNQEEEMLIKLIISSWRKMKTE